MRWRGSRTVICRVWPTRCRPGAKPSNAGRRSSSTRSRRCACSSSASSPVREPPGLRAPATRCYGCCGAMATWRSWSHNGWPGATSPSSRKRGVSAWISTGRLCGRRCRESSACRVTRSPPSGIGCRKAWRSAPCGRSAGCTRCCTRTSRGPACSAIDRSSPPTTRCSPTIAWAIETCCRRRRTCRWRRSRPMMCRRLDRSAASSFWMSSGSVRAPWSMARRRCC